MKDGFSNQHQECVSQANIEYLSYSEATASFGVKLITVIACIMVDMCSLHSGCLPVQQLNKAENVKHSHIIESA